MKPSPLEEQPVPLTAEPALQPRECQFLKLIHKNYPVVCMLCSKRGDIHCVISTTLYIKNLGICPLILFLITVATWPDYLVFPISILSRPSSYCSENIIFFPQETQHIPPHSGYTRPLSCVSRQGFEEARETFTAEKCSVHVQGAG